MVYLSSCLSIYVKSLQSLYLVNISSEFHRVLNSIHFFLPFPHFLVCASLNCPITELISLPAILAGVLDSFHAQGSRWARLG